MPTPAYGPLLDALRGVKWPARRAVRGALPGAHLSRLRGAAPEFSEYRPYRQGDDPRRLDWRLLARSDRAYVRLADERSVLPTLLIVDASASMDFPGGDAARSTSKWMRARELAVGLAAVAHAAGDPVGVVARGRRGEVRLPPRTRRGVVTEIAAALDALAPGGDAPLAGEVLAAPAGARVVVISDLLGDGDAVQARARVRAAAGGDMWGVHVVADEELDPPARAVLATDPEDATVRRPLTDASRDAYLQAFAAWRAELARAWQAAGAGFATVATGEPAARAIRRVVTPVAAEAART